MAAKLAPQPITISKFAQGIIAGLLGALVLLVSYIWVDHKNTEQRRYEELKQERAEVSRLESQKLNVIQGMQYDLSELKRYQKRTDESVQYIKKEVNNMKKDMGSVCQTLQEYADMMAWEKHGCEK